MKGVRFCSSVLKSYLLQPPCVFKLESSPCIFIRSKSTTSSLASLASSDIELSYSLYPTKEEPDANKIPLMFLHGLFGSKGNLHGIAKHLSSSGRRVVTYDARNHGSSGHDELTDFPSMVQDLHDLITELKFEQPALLGHSMGGKTVMTYALQYPNRVSSLIVADVSPQTSPGVNQNIQFAKAMNKVDIPQNVGIIKARNQVQIQLAPVIPDRDTVLFLLTNLVELKDGSIKWRMNLNSLLKALEKDLGKFPESNFEPCTKRALFLFGANSAHFKDADQGKIKALFPSAEIESIPGTSHLLHVEKPVEFSNIVQEFLKPVDIDK